MKYIWTFIIQIFLHGDNVTENKTWGAAAQDFPRWLYLSAGSVHGADPSSTTLTCCTSQVSRHNCKQLCLSANKATTCRRFCSNYNSEYQHRWYTKHFTLCHRIHSLKYCMNTSVTCTLLLLDASWYFCTMSGGHWFTVDSWNSCSCTHFFLYKSLSCSPVSSILTN